MGQGYSQAYKYVTGGPADRTIVIEPKFVNLSDQHSPNHTTHTSPNGHPNGFQSDSSLTRIEPPPSEPTQQPSNQPHKDCGKKWSVLSAGALELAWQAEYEASLMTFTPDGQLAVVHAKDNIVNVFSQDGTKTAQEHGKGIGLTTYMTPRGLCSDATGQLQVTCEQEKLVYSFRYDEKRKKCYEKNWGRGGFQSPRTICHTTQGDLIVVDENCLHVYNERRKRVRCFGQRHFQNPHSITCDNLGRIYVIDSAQKCAKVFMSDGTYLHDIGSNFLQSPHGVITDPKFNVMISDTWRDRVCVFAPDGRYIKEIEFASDVKQPTCLAIDLERKRLAVATKHLHWSHIKVFNIETCTCCHS